MVLSDTDIRAVIKSGDLAIDPSPQKIDPASVDLRVGEEGWGRQTENWLSRLVRSRRPGRIDISESKIIRFPRGSITFILTLETIKLSKKVSGMYGLRSRYAREGLILLSGPQIAPGFEGRLTATIFNAVTREVELSYAEPLATLVLSELKTPASQGYSGRYQHQSGVSSEEVKVATREYLSFDQIEVSLGEIRRRHDVIWYLFLAVIAGAMYGIFVALVSPFLQPSLPTSTSVEEIRKQLMCSIKKFPP